MSDERAEAERKKRFSLLRTFVLADFITLANAAQVLAAGADLLAVVSDVFGADDPAARAAAYRALF